MKAYHKQNCIKISQIQIIQNYSENKTVFFYLIIFGGLSGDSSLMCQMIRSLSD